MTNQGQEERTKWEQKVKWIYLTDKEVMDIFHSLPGYEQSSLLNDEINIYQYIRKEYQNPAWRQFWLHNVKPLKGTW